MQISLERQNGRCMTASSAHQIAASHSRTGIFYTDNAAPRASPWLVPRGPASYKACITYWALPYGRVCKTVLKQPGAVIKMGTQTNASVSSAAAVVQQDADVASVSSSFCHHCTLLRTGNSAQPFCLAQKIDPDKITTDKYLRRLIAESGTRQV